MIHAIFCADMVFPSLVATGRRRANLLASYFLVDGGLLEAMDADVDPMGGSTDM